jgi:hypothetical protein
MVCSKFKNMDFEKFWWKCMLGWFKNFVEEFVKTRRLTLQHVMQITIDLLWITLWRMLQFSRN